MLETPINLLKRKYGGLSRKYGVSNKNMGVSNKNIGVYNENMGVSNENIFLVLYIFYSCILGSYLFKQIDVSSQVLIINIPLQHYEAF